MEKNSTPDYEWRDYRQCNGINPNDFFPIDPEGPEAEVAKAICKLCDVRLECLEYAMEKREKLGVWGGTTPRDRRRLSRQRRQLAS